MRGTQEWGRDAADERVLDFAHGFAWGNAGPVAETEDVGVHGHRVLAEGDVQDNVGGLAAYARERLECCAVGRHDAAVALDEEPGEFGDIFGLGLPEAEALDVGGDAVGPECSHGGRVGGVAKEGVGGAIDGGIGRLRGEHDGDQKGEGIAEGEFAGCVGVGFGQALDEGADVGAGHFRGFARGAGHSRISRKPGECASRADRSRDAPDIGFMSDPAVTFEAVIIPHRSLGRRGLRWIAVSMAGLSGLVSLGLWMAGAWPVIGFTGLEAAAAVWLMRRHALGPRGSEMLLLSGAGLRVIRVDGKGRRTERVVDVGWLRADLDDRRGRVPALMLRGGGVALEVGAALGEAEKLSLAESLGDALERQRRPTFDNPQLREVSPPPAPST